MKRISIEKLMMISTIALVFILLRCSMYKLNKIYEEKRSNTSIYNIKEIQYDDDATYRPVISNGHGSLYANSNEWFSTDFPPICINSVIYKDRDILIDISVGLGNNEPINIQNLLNSSILLELRDKDGNKVEFDSFEVCKSPNQKKSIYIGKTGIINSPSNSNQNSNSDDPVLKDETITYDINQVTLKGDNLNSAKYLMVKNYKTSSNEDVVFQIN